MSYLWKDRVPPVVPVLKDTVGVGGGALLVPSAIRSREKSTCCWLRLWLQIKWEECVALVARGLG